MGVGVFVFKSPLFLTSLLTTSMLAPGSEPQAKTLQQAFSVLFQGLQG